MPHSTATAPEWDLKPELRKKGAVPEFNGETAGKKRSYSDFEDGRRPGMYPEWRENPRKSSEGTESERVARDAGQVCGSTLRQLVYSSPPAAKPGCVNCSVSVVVANPFGSVCRELAPGGKPFTDLMGASTLVSTLWARSSSCTLALEP